MEKVIAYEKDPKKVTAGRAGAVARKKNHQAFLDGIRDATAHPEPLDFIVLAPDPPRAAEYSRRGALGPAASALDVPINAPSPPRGTHGKED